MPTFDVTIRVNVPGLGQRDVPYTAIVATSMQQAVQQVIANVIVIPIQVTQTAP